LNRNVCKNFFHFHFRMRSCSDISKRKNVTQTPNLTHSFFLTYFLCEWTDREMTQVLQPIDWRRCISYTYYPPDPCQEVCCISHEPIVDPITVSCCDQTLCRSCFEENDRRCPLSPNSHIHFEIIPAPKMLRNLFDAFQVRCPSRDQIFQRSLLPNHYEKVCLKVKVRWLWVDQISLYLLRSFG
jgi:hypothetical protein